MAILYYIHVDRCTNLSWALAQDYEKRLEGAGVGVGGGGRQLSMPTFPETSQSTGEELINNIALSALNPLNFLQY